MGAGYVGKEMWVRKGAGYELVMWVRRGAAYMGKELVMWVSYMGKELVMWVRKGEDLVTWVRS